MPLAFPFLVISGAVFFAGVYLLMASIASSSTDRPRAESSGVLSGLTWATDAIGRAWHRLVRATYSHFAESHLVPLVRWFGSLNALFLGVAATLADSAEAEAEAVARLTGKVIPAKIHEKVQPVAKTANAATRSADAANAKVASTTKDFAHYRTATNARVNHATHAVDVALPGSIAHVNRRVDVVERDIKQPSHALLSRWAKWLWAAGLAGLFIRTLARRFPWLFCRKVNTLGKRMCGLDDDLIAGLLQGTLLLAGTVSLVEFVRDAQAVERVAIDALHSFIRDV